MTRSSPVDVTPSPRRRSHRLSVGLGLFLSVGICASVAQGQTPPLPTLQGVVLVSSEKDHALTVIDLASTSVVGSIPTCKRPRHLQRLGARQVVVACGDSNLADVIDLDRKASVRRFPLGESPEIFDVSADGKTLYVSNEEDAKVSAIEVSTGKLMASIRVGEEPEGLLLSRDGKRIYVASEVANQVQVIDVASRKVIQDIPVGKRPRRFVQSPDGREVWVSHELDASVSVIDTQRLAVTGTVRFELKGARRSDITPVGMVMSPDGKTVFVGLGQANHVAFVDTASRSVRATVLVGKRAWGVSLDRKAATLAVVNGLSDDLTFVDVASARALKSVRVGRVPHSALFIEEAP